MLFEPFRKAFSDKTFPLGKVTFIALSLTPLGIPLTFGFFGIWCLKDIFSLTGGKYDI